MGNIEKNAFSFREFLSKIGLFSRELSTAHSENIAVVAQRLVSGADVPGASRTEPTCAAAAFANTGYKEFAAGAILVSSHCEGNNPTEGRGGIRQSATPWKIATCTVLYRPRKVWLFGLWDLNQYKHCKCKGESGCREGIPDIAGQSVPQQHGQPGAPTGACLQKLASVDGSCRVG